MFNMKQALGRLRDREWVANRIRRLAGIVIIAGGYLVFLIPAYIVPGGVVGLSAVIVRLTGNRLPVGGVTWSVNVLIYLSTLHLFGVRHIARVFVTSSVLAVLLDVFGPWAGAHIIPALYGPDPTAPNPNLALYAAAGGAMVGTGMAIIYRWGGATGGTDVLAQALHRRFPRYSFSQYMLFVDGAVILLIVIVLQNWNLALYAIAVKFVTARVMDALLAGVSAAKGVQIITGRPEPISLRIFQELKRGVTATHCTGMYTHHDRMMLFCVVKTEQVQRIKAIVQEEDPEAFVVLNDLKEVMGKGFSGGGV
jgi:uncharacterized membrane-anchored protein YitT (DUF2179 family)